MSLRPQIYRSLALALLAAPVGWITSGVLAAASEHRYGDQYRLYVARDDNVIGAALAVGIVFAAALLWQRARPNPGDEPRPQRK